MDLNSHLTYARLEYAWFSRDSPDYWTSLQCFPNFMSLEVRSCFSPIRRSLVESFARLKFVEVDQAPRSTDSPTKRSEDPNI